NKISKVKIKNSETSSKLVVDFYKIIPFQLTQNQKKVINEIKDDINTDSTMVRMLQGDVGSGKTIVALISMLHAISDGSQAVLLVPTEILAIQHYHSIKDLTKDMNLEINLLLGETRHVGNKKSRLETIEKIKSGVSQIIIGTHALFSKKIEYNNLSLAVIDEQHRFGVKQRLEITEKGKNVDVLVMTATPIPRSLALTAYGDMNISSIKEKPTGRIPIKTYVMPQNKLEDVLLSIRRAISKGDLIYWVCPLIEESEGLDLVAVNERYEFLKNYFVDLQISLVHGKQNQEEREKSIEEIISDFEIGKLMDRLICGDVGFGKTEVAIRASFIIASAGYQVALVAPTTILVKQHYKSFFERFKNTSIKVSALSRMTNVSERQSIKKDLISGDINIIIGTHALLSNDVDFNNLGLLIIDEEQHFGVAQKEKIKELQGNIHVLTLTATPIPRTLQLSLSGIKKLSLISTPPVDRLAIRTFVIEWDSVVLIDALLREKNRGGQIFVVCPRVKDIDSLYDRINKMSPELSISVAHGQMKVNELDKSINDFSEGKVDILISTNIIESGIDIPNANTMIIHKSDMFGLSQLYQLRGRVGRGKQRAYAYFTIEKNKILLKKSQQRLDVIKTLDNLGAGFSLASYDMDIRGAGNLLGDEQSGQIKEVGVELYQDMLNDAVNSFKSGSKKIEDVWSPSISLGLSVLIPENYVYDLSTRMSLYRKAGELLNSDDIKNFSDELFDRFGPPPSEVNNLLTTLMIKNKCLKSKISFVD
ncbi:DEAD/DEAH box helicase, partial [Alphaproteobacteria bacterium]|nr:DEAD/DEAH box helicase [Alphaproteobacteria bacterium]